MWYFFYFVFRVWNCRRVNKIAGFICLYGKNEMLGIYFFGVYKVWLSKMELFF